MNKLTVELNESQLNIVIGALASFLTENEIWIKNYQSKPETNEFVDESYFMQLSENIEATELMFNLGRVAGWTDNQLNEFLAIIKKEVESK